MKKNYTLKILTVTFLYLTGQLTIAQSVEDFESEVAASTTFTDASQTFTISSTTGEGYNIFSDNFNDNGSFDVGNGLGWNGFAADNKFIDNNGNYNHNNMDGSSFTIATGGAQIGITSLYLYCSTRNFDMHSGSLTIAGYKGGIMQYSFTKTNGFNNPNNFETSNGFTFINFATEGASNFTQVKIDELVFTSTGNLDYMALDAFSWSPGSTLTIDDYKLSNDIEIYPNPSSNFIQLKNSVEEKNFTIYNELGMETMKGTNLDNRINIQNLSPGIYFLKFENTNAIKFIKK